VIALVLFTVFKQFGTRGQAGNGYLAYSDFLEEVRGKRIKSATIQEGQGGTEIIATTTDDRKVRTNATYLDRGLVGDLIANNVKFDPFFGLGKTYQGTSDVLAIAVKQIDNALERARRACLTKTITR